MKTLRAAKLPPKVKFMVGVKLNANFPPRFMRKVGGSGLALYGLKILIAQ